MGLGLHQQQQREVEAPQITTAPDLELLRRADTNYFVGWSLLANGKWDSITCDDNGWTFSESKPFGATNPGYAACLTIGDDVIPTSCGAGTLYYPKSSITCNPGYSCVTGLVASTTGAEFSGDLYNYCGDIADWVVYRTTPGQVVAKTTPTTAVPTTQVNSGASSIATSAIQTSGSASTHSSASAGAQSSSTTSASASATPAASKAGVSGALIAGAVVGPICVVALILGLAFLFLRRRRSHKPDTPAAMTGPANAARPDSQYPPPGYTTYYDNGQHAEGKEAVQVTASPAMTQPSPQPNMPATWGPPPPPPPQQPMYPVQATSPVHQSQMQGNHVPPASHGHGASELPTNPQVTGMPSELPAWSR